MKKPIDLAKMREGDELLRRAKALDPQVRMPTLDDLQEMTGKRSAGRPKGPEPTTTITIRLPESLKERLDRHLDRLETQTGIKANRGAIARHALKRYLEEQDRATKTPRRRK
jgi:hypothetical protein